MMFGAPRGYTEMKKLSKTLKVNIPDLCALSPKNDPFFAGSPGHWRAAEWFAANFERFGGAGGHIRRMHYRMLEQGIMLPTGTDGRARGEQPYVNDSTCWAATADAAKFARHLGLVDPEDLIDRRNDPVRPYGEIVLQPGQSELAAPTWSFDRGYWTAQIGEIAWLPEFPTPDATGYSYDRNRDQPVGIEVFVEKSGVDDVLDPLCRRLGVNLLVGTGYESITQIVALLRRASRPTRVLYISDHDPAGLNMPCQVGRHVEFYGDEYGTGDDILVRHLVLTPQQIDEFRLPHAPDSKKVELDALEALHPGALVKIVTEAVQEWRDDDLHGRLDDAEAEADETVQEAWQTALNDRGLSERIERLAEGAAAARDRVNPWIGLLRVVVDQAVGPLRVDYEAISDELDALADELDVHLPDRPQGEVPDIDTDEYLFDNTRDYFTQLDYYKQHKNGGA